MAGGWYHHSSSALTKNAKFRCARKTESGFWQKLKSLLFTHQFSSETFVFIWNLFQSHQSQVAAQRWCFWVCPAQWAGWTEPGSQAADRSSSPWHATPSGRSSTAALWESPEKYSCITTYVLTDEYYKMCNSLLHLLTYHPTFSIQLEDQFVLIWILLILLDFLVRLFACFWQRHKQQIHKQVHNILSANTVVQKYIKNKNKYR